MSEKDTPELITEGNALEDAGRIQDALERYDEAIRLTPAMARAHLNRGNALLALGDAKQAIEAYVSALAHDPAYAATVLGYAQRMLSLRMEHVEQTLTGLVVTSAGVLDGRR